MRCIRAGVQCTTGYSKPLGRAVREMATVHPPFNAETAAVSSADMTWVRPNASNSTARSTQRSPLTTVVEPTSPTIEDSLNLSGSYMHESSLVSDPSYFSNAAFHPMDRMDERMGYVSDELDNLPLIHTPSEPAIAGHSGSTIEEQLNHHKGGGVESVEPGAECDLRLSWLGVDLCRQMQLCMTRSEPWSTTTMKACTSENLLELMEKGSSTDGTPNSSPFGDALRSTSEFLAIIQSYSPNASSPAPASSPAGLDNGYQTERNNATRWRLSRASILNLLFSYLRIIEIYDRLILRLSELLSCGGSESSGLHGPQTLPGLQLAGFSVQQGSLQTKIIIQAIQHQFEMIEKTLGLPTEFRLSDRQDVYRTGLLEGEYAEALLHAVMSDSHDGGGGPAPTGSLESLRGNIMKVRQIVDMST